MAEAAAQASTVIDTAPALHRRPTRSRLNNMFRGARHAGDAARACSATELVGRRRGGLLLRRRIRGAAAPGRAGRPGDAGALPRHRQAFSRDARLSRRSWSSGSGLTDLRILPPDPDVLAAKDENGLRWSYDPDGCCEIRKVDPAGQGAGRRSTRRSPAARASRRRPAPACRASRSTETATGSRSTRSPTGPRRDLDAYFDGARPAPPPAGGAGLSLDRLRAVHQHGQARRRPPRGPLARLGQGRMRHPRGRGRGRSGEPAKLLNR